MPRTRGADVGRGVRRAVGRGKGRGQGTGVKPEAVPGRRGSLRTRGPRVSGAALENMDRSHLYVGDIVTSAPLSSSTVPRGIPMEVPLHVKKKLNLKCEPVEETIAVSPSSPQDASPNITPSSSVPHLKVGDIVTLAPVSSSTVPCEDPLEGSRHVKKTLKLKYEPIEQTILVFPSTPQDTSPSITPSSSPQDASPSITPSSSVSKSRKRRLVYNELEPALANIGNHGSDQDTDDDTDDEGNPYLQCPRSDLIFFDVSDVLTAPEYRTVQDHIDPPPSASAAMFEAAQSSSSSSDPSATVSSASVSLNEVVYGPQLAEFVWQPLPTPAIPPWQRREIFTSRVGPASAYSTPYEAFVAIWDRSIMEYIAAETNRYAEQTLKVALRRGDLAEHSRLPNFKETNADELYVLFALTIATGIVVKSDLTEIWSVNDDIFDTPNFSRYMSYTRYAALNRMLHFTDNEEDIGHLSRSDAKIAKLAPIIKHLNAKFQALYELGQCIALDESLTQWKGALNINQLMKNKAATKGIKTYEICDSSSGYLWRFKVHAGRNYEGNELGSITSLVLDLLKGLENKGHTVFMDNYYNSPLLARLLKSRGFDCAGTLRLNRQHVPADLKGLVKQPLGAGSVHGATSGDVDVLIWKDHNVVSLISTYHGAASASRDGKSKPTLVHDYNVRMGGVDKKDQMLSAYPIERKRTAVWYKKLFRRLLNVSVLNSYILFRDSPPVPGHPHRHRTKHRQFRKMLVKEILAKHVQQERVTLQTRISNVSSQVKFSLDVVRHFPTELPYMENLRQRKRKSCRVCQKRTTFQCTGCKVGLCIKTCFVHYHS